MLVVVGCSRAPQVIEPEEIDVCPVLAGQVENLLETMTDFVAGATIEELEAPDGTAAELRQRGIDLSERADALGCDRDELRSLISTSSLESDDPIAQIFIDLVVDALPQS